MANSHIPAPSGSGEHAPTAGRHHQRYPAYFNVTLTDLAEPEPPVTGFIANVSQQGVSLITPIALNTGHAVKLNIADTVLFGKVVHSSPEGDYFRTGVTVQLPVSGAGFSELLRTMLIEPLPVDPAAQDKPPKIIRRSVSRRHLRYPVSGMLRVLWRDGDGGERILNAKIGDASAMGARLRIDEMIPVRSYVSCNDEKLRIRGTASVRYCRFVKGKYDIGVEFGGGSGWRKPGDELAGRAAGI